MEVGSGGWRPEGRASVISKCALFAFVLVPALHKCQCQRGGDVVVLGGYVGVCVVVVSLLADKKTDDDGILLLCYLPLSPVARQLL